MGLELMAQTVAVIHANKIVGIDNVHFERPIKFHREQTVQLEVETHIVDQKSIDCQLYSIRDLPVAQQRKALHSNNAF